MERFVQYVWLECMYVYIRKYLILNVWKFQILRLIIMGIIITKKCINLHIFHRLEKHMTWLVTCMHTWQIILILQGVPRGYGTPYKTWTKSIDFTLTTNVWREAFDMIFDVKTTWWYSTCWMTLWQDVILMTFDNDIIWLWRWQQNVTKFVFLNLWFCELYVCKNCKII